MGASAHSRLVASHLLRLGVLFCPACVGMREFVSYDPHCKHITDAFCCDCGHVFGRYDCIDELAGMRPGVVPGDDPPILIRGAKVISDEQAAAAAARLGHGAIDMAQPAAALLPPPPPAWRPGKYAVPTGAEPPPAPTTSSPPPASAPRAKPMEVVGGRSEEFLQYLRRERELHGRT